MMDNVTTNSRRNFIKTAMGGVIMSNTTPLLTSALKMPVDVHNEKTQAGKLAILQIDSRPGDVDANLEQIASMVHAINDKQVRMAVFCEYGTTGYSVDLAALAEDIPGKTVKFLEKLSAQKNIWISGGMIEKGTRGKPFNTSVMISPTKGLVAKYRKVHVFSFENDHLDHGDNHCIVETELGKVALTICYDLVFPEYIRGLALKGANIILNSTFWFADNISGPAGWSPEQSKAMAVTRALENNVFVAMACRTGTEKDLWGFGNSVIVAPQGKIIASCGREVETISAPIDLNIRNTWGQYATYMADRRTDVYRRLLDL